MQQPTAKIIPFDPHRRRTSPTVQIQSRVIAPRAQLPRPRGSTMHDPRDLTGTKVQLPQRFPAPELGLIIPFVSTWEEKS